jgi:3-hydroxybutyrate dehydrogenase
MLKGKSALVTVSLGGIGFATARALAGLGCDVMLNGFAAGGTIASRLTELKALGVRLGFAPRIMQPICASRHRSRR